MRLHIENINFWDNYNVHIDILNYKHILLCGSSGTGKSTILNCIYYAITGSGMTNKWNVKNNKKKGIIKLEILEYNIEIERTLNPKSLIVRYNNTEKTGEEAQIVLDGIFNLFDKLGYIKQKSSYFYFINMTPKDRMLFFESILFNNIDIDTIKQKIKTKIDEYKNNFIHEEKMLNTLEKPESKEKIEFSYITKLENKIEDIELELQKYNTCEQELFNLKNLLAKMEEEYYINKQELDLIDEQQKFLNQNINNDKSKYVEWVNTVQHYEQNNILHSSYEKIQTAINSKITDIYKELNDLKDKLVDIDELEEQLLFERHNYETYQSYLNIDKQIQKLNFESTKYTQLLQTFNDLYLFQYECPSCNTLLNVHGSKLKIAKSINTDKYKNTPNLKTDLDIMKTKYTKYTMLKEELDNLHSKLTYPIKTEKELIEMENKKNEQIKYHERYKQLNEELKNNIVYTNMTQPPKNKTSNRDYLNKKDLINLYESYVNKYNTNQELYNNLYKKFQSIEKNIQDVKDKIKLLTISVSEKKTTEIKLNESNEELYTANVQYNFNKQFGLTNELKEKWQDMILFNNVVNKSISDVMLYTLNSINFTIQKYIKGFFDKELTMTFNLNTDKYCIDISLSPDINTLSGGEYDRLVLAITLAFSEFFKLPLLCLDEIVNSLDIYTTQKVITFIKHHYPMNQAIIFVGHQMIQGMFDSIVCLDDSSLL